jgi:HAD superfamily hydrolase (TIGR01490 family)
MTQTLALFDLDKTLMTLNSTFSFSLTLKKRGLLDFSLLHSLLYYLQYRFFGLSLQDLHSRAFDKVLKGRFLKELELQVEPFISHHLEKSLYLPALEQLRLAQQNYSYIVLLSSSPDFIVGPIAKKLEIHHYHATRYHCNHQGELTAIDRIVDGAYKAQEVIRLKKKLNIPQENIYAYSDSIDDLLFLEAVGHPFGVNPDKSLKKVCLERGWKII